MLKQMENRGWKVEGVEISQEAVTMAKENYGYNLFLGDYLSYKPSVKYDVICMFQTLEHLLNPKKILEKNFEELKNNGILVIEVPNYHGWDIKFNKNKKELIYDLPRHVNHFTPGFLKKELKKIGFEILLVDKYYPDFILKIFDKKNRQNNKGENKIDNEKSNDTYIPLLKINKTKKGKIIDLFSNIFQGWKFTIVARKM
jgi:SAM-dependent methyltransferase